MKALAKRTAALGEAVRGGGKMRSCPALNPERGREVGESESAMLSGEMSQSESSGYLPPTLQVRLRDSKLFGDCRYQVRKPRAGRQALKARNFSAPRRLADHLLPLTQEGFTSQIDLRD